MGHEKILALADKAGLWYPMGINSEALHGRARLCEFASLIEAETREAMINAQPVQPAPAPPTKE